MPEVAKNTLFFCMLCTGYVTIAERTMDGRVNIQPHMSRCPGVTHNQNNTCNA